MACTHPRSYDDPNTRLRGRHGDTKLKIGDLVRKPSSNRPRGVVGVIVDVTSRHKDGLIGVSWPDIDGVVYERALYLDVVG